MPLHTGSHLGPYEILAPIGAGGMGEVYRARDTRLSREVAIKISAQQFSERFEREARVIASVNHPNICTLHDVGPNYLVMELVEGMTLADRVKEGPLPLEETLAIAKQIADALEAAHEQGITHRDLKPANIKIKPDGMVKVLDFGLAKSEGAQAIQTGDSPTIATAMTQAGVIIGTAAYMSPEQVKGKPADKRSDIWAFGVVLYEMLTGAQLFQGETFSETLAAVLRHEVDWKPIPAKVERLLRRCLERDPKQRLRDIGDYRLLLEDGPPESTPAPSRRAWVGWIAAALALAALAVLLAVHFSGGLSATAETVRFQLELPEKVVSSTQGGSTFAISPDGRMLVLVAAGTDGVSRLWIRAMDSLEVKSLPGSDGARAPFWSPDSRYVGFGAGGKLKKIDIVSGAPPVPICDLPGNTNYAGGAWNRDGVILLGQGPGVILRVSAGGGELSPVHAPDLGSGRPSAELFPSFLPDQKHFLFMRLGPAGVYVGSLDAKQEIKKLSVGSLGYESLGTLYSPSPNDSIGKLLFLRDGTLMTQDFDSERLEPSGEATPLEGVDTRIGLASFSASRNTLVYRSAAVPELQLTWFDNQGKVLGTVGESGTVGQPPLFGQVSISPDGKRAAVTRDRSRDVGIWLFNLLSNDAPRRFTFSNVGRRYPVWSPDSSKIAFTPAGGDLTLYQKDSSDVGDEIALFKGTGIMTPTDWSRDGRYLIYTGTDTKTKNDIWVLPLEGDHKPFSFAKSESSERNGVFSPDTRWIAYISDESGKDELYVRRFMPPDEAAEGGKQVISTRGAVQARWPRESNRLFYLAPDGEILSVEVKNAPGFQYSTPQPLFPRSPAREFGWDVTPDGKRFLISVPAADRPSVPFTVILNWQSVSKRKD